MVGNIVTGAANKAVNPCPSRASNFTVTGVHNYIMSCYLCPRVCCNCLVLLISYLLIYMRVFSLWIGSLCYVRDKVNFVMEW